MATYSITRITDSYVYGTVTANTERGARIKGAREFNDAYAYLSATEVPTDTPHTVNTHTHTDYHVEVSSPEVGLYSLIGCDGITLQEFATLNTVSATALRDALTDALTAEVEVNGPETGAQGLSGASGGKGEIDPPTDRCPVCNVQGMQSCVADDDTTEVPDHKGRPVALVSAPAQDAPRYAPETVVETYAFDDESEQPEEETPARMPGRERAIRDALRTLEQYALYVGMADSTSLRLTESDGFYLSAHGTYVTATDGQRTVILSRRVDGSWMPWRY